MLASLHSAESIRVALDARYVREKPSGIGVYVQALVDRLPEDAPNDQFVFWAHPRAARPLSRAANTSEVTISAGPNSPWPVLWPRRYASFAGIDVFHSPHNVMPRGLPCASVVTVHDVMALEHPRLHLRGFERAVKRAYYQQAIWRALRHATCLIAPSQATADRICVLAPEAAPRLTVIPEAADSCFRPAEDLRAAQNRAARLLGNGAPYLLVVGANTPTKRHALAIAAFAAGVPMPWRLVLLQRRLTGKGLEPLAWVEIAHRLTWLDAVTSEDVVTLMQGAGALIQPSVYEGFGLPVLEAMACGCPVVASDIAPFREITAGSALLVRPDDLGKLAAAMREVVQSPDLRRSLSQQGLARAQDFSWDRCAHETLEVYHAAARAGR
jgi:glycosyltransferase involved in cell wall biosynthesis